MKKLFRVYATITQEPCRNGEGELVGTGNNVCGSLQNQGAGSGETLASCGGGLSSQEIRFNRMRQGKQVSV